jgi:selenocysteine-specific elongation factor
MYVVATAGHVDHGKSTLVRALTGMEPDRWAEERRRGMTIDLGYAWMTLPAGDAGRAGDAGPAGDAGRAGEAGPAGEQLAFVDVPGHERFVPNMLAGLGPVPAVMFVVAADGGWMPQSAEHLAAVHALGVRHGLLAVTRCDLADPAQATRQALAEIARTSLGRVPAVPVSAVTGQGLDDLRSALARLAAALGAARPARPAPVRLWIDRSFTIRGAGTVVTGTLPAGTVRNGQELILSPPGHPVRVRGLEALGEPADAVAGVARVALNLRGIPADRPARGMALIEPGQWTVTSEIDVRVTPPAADPQPRLPADLLVHIGSARTQARVRILGSRPATESGPTAAPANPPAPASAPAPASPPAPASAPIGPPPSASPPVPASASAPANPPAPISAFTPPPASAGAEAGAGSSPAAIYARLRLRDPLPLHAGDRVILRDPGAAGLAIYGATVLDPFPPPLARRGAGAAAVRELGDWPDVPRAADLLRRHKLLRAPQLAAAGIAGLPEPVARDWLADPEHWAWLRAELPKAVVAFCARDPLAPGMPAEAARAALGLPTRDLVPALAGGDVLLDGAYLRIFTKHAEQEAETPSADTTRRDVGAAAGLAPGESQGSAASPAPGNRTGSAAGLGSGSAAGPASGKGPDSAAGQSPGTSTAAAAGQLPPRIAEAVQAVRDALTAEPFAAPDTERLRELGLDARALAAAARVGLLLRVADLVVLAPGADKEAARVLAGLDQPFTTSQARQALNTSRRVAIPLLEYLDRARVTERLPGDLRRIRT